MFLRWTPSQTPLKDHRPTHPVLSLTGVGQPRHAGPGVLALELQPARQQLALWAGVGRGGAVPGRVRGQGDACWQGQQIRPGMHLALLHTPSHCTQVKHWGAALSLI